MENEKIKKVVKVVCLQECADDRQKFEAGVVYDLVEDHPCRQYFKKVRETNDPAQMGPLDVVLKGGKHG